MAADKNPFKSENTLKAFFMVHRKIAERLPATIWIFEHDAYADSFVLCDSDIQYPNECIPATNLWKYSCTNRNASVQEDSSNKTNSEKNEVQFVSVRKKDTRKLLRHLLIIKHLRIEIFRFNSSLFEKVKKASPSDLTDVKDILFGEDGEAEYSEILGLGPICSLHLAGDIR
jgi:choline kinase